MVKGTIFNIQKYSINDGPGIRTIVFLKGCPLKCEWCSNPESQEMKKLLVFKAGDCIGCGKCVEMCPTGNRKTEDFKMCEVACGRCTLMCPTNALEVIGEEKTVQEVIKEVEKDRKFYIKSGGGLTISGGEPLMQHEFAYELAKAAKANHINTAIETTGFASWEAASKVFSQIDYILFDVKSMDDETHIKYTGVSNKLILENLEKLAATRADDITIRIPLIEPVNADEENIIKTAQMAQRLGITKLHLLPYHKYGEGKYNKLYKEYTFEGITPSDETLDRYVELLKNYGIEAKISG